MVEQMTPFPLKWLLGRAPINEDERLYMQAAGCLAGAAWRYAAGWTAVRADGMPSARLREAEGLWRFADELVEGATVYLQLRADLRSQAPG